MSQENVELVKALHPPSGVKLSDVFSEDGDGSALAALAPLLAPDVEVRGGDSPSGGIWIEARGIDGLIQTWRDWLEPWEEYWTTVEDFLDAGDETVVVLVHDHGRLRGSDAEVELKGGSVWTVREGRIARIEFHTSREGALRAAGLAD